MVRIFAYITLWLLLCSCRPKPGVAQNGLAVPSDAVFSVSAPPQSGKDEERFLKFFAGFRDAVKQMDTAKLVKMIHFPLQTGIRWEDNDRPADITEGRLRWDEFPAYYTQLFNKDVVRIVSKSGDRDIESITDTPGDYYRTVKEGTDKGAMVYELYRQFSLAGSAGESYFGFVFGRVKGQYKVIAYYGKWPVKG
jgi:hypothetical protein